MMRVAQDCGRRCARLHESKHVPVGRNANTNNSTSAAARNGPRKASTRLSRDGRTTIVRSSGTHSPRHEQDAHGTDRTYVDEDGVLWRRRPRHLHAIDRQLPRPIDPLGVVADRPSRQWPSRQPPPRAPRIALVATPAPDPAATDRLKNPPQAAVKSPPTSCSVNLVSLHRAPVPHNRFSLLVWRPCFGDVPEAGHVLEHELQGVGSVKVELGFVPRHLPTIGRAVTARRGAKTSIAGLAGAGIESCPLPGKYRLRLGQR